MVRRAAIVALMAILLLGTVVGCGEKSDGGKNDQAEREKAQRLVDLYADYLHSGDPALIDQMAAIYPSCVVEDEAGRHIDEEALLEYVSTFDVDLTALNAYDDNTFDSSKYPLDVGVVKVYYTQSLFEEDKGRVPVSFTLEGPWDFSQESVLPTDKLNETTWESVESPYYASFPAATHAVRADSLAGTIIHYLSEDNNGVYEYGIFSVDGGQHILTFNEPNILVEFPLRVGRTWESSFLVMEGGREGGTVSRKRRVLSKNKIILPVATYEDAYLVQEKQHEVINGKSKDCIKYYWYVPYIGEVARIQSLENETSEVFEQADAFWRLLDTNLSKPAN